MSPTRYSLSLALAVLLCGGTLQANDAVFGGQGVNLIPTQETRVRMASELIVLEQVPNEAFEEGGESHEARLQWHVTGTYRFENPTAQTIRLQLGFPETRCVDSCYARRGEFQGLSTTVRGQAVAQREGSVALGDRWSHNLSRVYLFDVTFAPHEAVEIVHRYTYDWSQCVGGELVNYVTQTGRLWAGPIGQARFVVRPLRKPWLVYAPPEYVLQSYTHRPTNKPPGNGTELVFEMRNWTPTADFDLFLLEDYGCANSVFDLRCDRDDWEQATEEERATCQALVLARHGQRFDDPALARRFYSMPPEPTEGEQRCAFWDPETPAQRLWLFENPHHANSLLDADDRALLAQMGGSFARGAASSDEASPAGPPAAQAPAVPPPHPAATRPTPGCGHCMIGTGGNERHRGLVWALSALVALHYRRRR